MDYVRWNRVRQVSFAVIGLALVFLPAALFFVPHEAVGTEAMMQKLPAYERYRCLLCHVTASPTPVQHNLNPFGNDFLNNNSLWDPTLAQLNSDGDRCSNGAEIGDRDGDGIHDDAAAQPRELSNPGNPSDCTSPIDPATWGIIKEIFSREINLFVLADPEYEYFALYFGP
jgi:hypothetical protein